MIYFFQSLSLKTRFLGLLLSFLLMIGFWWLLTEAPWALAHLRVLSQGAGLPDSGLWSAPQALLGLLEQWGPEGRILYLTVLAPTGLGFVLTYGLFLVMATLYLLKKSNPAMPWWYLLPLLPLVGAVSGFLEIGAVAVAAVLPPQESEAAAWAAFLFSSLRWTAFGVSFVILAAGSLLTLIRKGWDRVKETLSGDEPKGKDR
jgi:hypothetical protein